MVPDVQLQDSVEHVHDLAVVDHLLVGEVSDAGLDQSLQDEVHQLHGLLVDVSVEVLENGGRRGSDVHTHTRTHTCTYTYMYIRWRGSDVHTHTRTHTCTYTPNAYIRCSSISVHT